jgi:carboxymethylenebutenolidase
MDVIKEEFTMGEMITFPANGGTCPGYLAKATSDAVKGVGVIVLQEWWGLNDQIKDVADRFAARGYHALAPDLYRGVVTTEPDEAGKMLMALNVEQAAKDMRGAIAYLREMTGKPVGTIGFCMGGALSLYAACDNPDGVGACVDFYGGHPAFTPNVEALQAPVLGIFAEKDGFVNAQFVQALDAQMNAAGKEHEFITYPGTDHAFFNDERPQVYDADASADAWKRSLEHFAKNLG